MKQLAPKLLVLLFSFFLYIPSTNAFFQDNETSSGNSFSAASLDFYLETLQDFDTFLLPDNPQTRDLNFHNLSSLPIFYNIGTSQTSGNSAVYQALNLVASVEGNQVYSGPLMLFSLSSPRNINIATIDQWSFQFSLSSSGQSLQSSSCDFDFIFNSGQDPSLSFGFHYQRNISVLVETGDWTSPSSEITSIQDYSTFPTFTIDYDSSDDTDFVQLCYSFNMGDWICDPSYIDHPASLGSFSFDSPQGDGLYDFYTLATDHASNVEDDTGKTGLPYSVQVDTQPPTTNIDLDSLPLDQWDGQNLLVNGDFESGLDGWVVDPDSVGDHQAVLSSTDWFGDPIDPVSGTQMLQLGFKYSPLLENAFDAVYQTIHIPTKLSSNLSFNYRFLSDDTADYDQFSAKIISWTGNLLENILITGDTSFSPGQYDSDWRHISHSLLNYAGHTIKLWFGLTNKDLVGDPRESWALIDDVRVSTLDTRVGETSVISFETHDVGSGLDQTPFDVDSQVGENQLDFYSTDMIGNIEDTHSSDVVVLPPVVLNKIYPAPSPGDEGIELFNNTLGDINLNTWSICDLASHCQPISQTISAGSTLSLNQDFYLNNDGDTVYLKDDTDSIVDEFTYPDHSGHNWYWQRSPNGIGTWELIVADMDFNLISRSVVDKITLSVFNIPSIYGQSGTDNLEYEIIYNSIGIPKGIAGHINPDAIVDGKADYDFYLGTCTTGGVCTPDVGIGATVSVIISGSINSVSVTSTKTFDY